MTMGLRVPQGSSFREMAMQHGAQGLSAYAQQHPGSKTEITPPDKTAGGALMAGAGMAMAGAELGGMFAGAGAAAGAGGAGAAAAAGGAAGLGAGGVGAIIGAGVGILAYMMS